MPMVQSETMATDSSEPRVPIPEENHTFWRDRDMNQNEGVHFKDAVGRKFTFPFHMVEKWSGMEEMIKAAFEKVDLLSAQVEQGKYDIWGPTGKIILPQTWEHIIKPGDAILMTMRPTYEFPSLLPPARTLRPNKKPEMNDQSGPIRYKQTLTYKFLESNTTNTERSLHLVLFPFSFNTGLGDDQITISLKLDLHPENGISDLEVAKLAFFRPLHSGLEQTINLDTREMKTEASSELRVTSPEAHIFAILVWAPNKDGKINFSWTLGIKHAHHGGAWDRAQPVQTASIDTSTMPGDWTPLSWAANYGWHDALTFLLEQPEILEKQRDKRGRSALSWVAGSGYQETTEMLLEQLKAWSKDEDSGGRTPLSWAAGNGHVGTMRLFFKHDEVHSGYRPDNRGRSPLAWAAGNGHVEAVEFLINYRLRATGGSEVLTDDEDPQISPIACAVRGGHSSVLRILIEESLQRFPEHKDSQIISSCLNQAAKEGWAPVVKLLIERGVRVDSKNPGRDNQTPLCAAAEHGHAEVVRILLNAGAERDYQIDRTLDTPLNLAILYNCEAVVKVLLDFGAFVNLENANGQTPIDLAKAKANPTILNMVVAVNKEGRLAEEDRDVNLEVDSKFRASIVDFIDATGIKAYKSEFVDVGCLLKNPRCSSTDAANISFRWLHLPANNMRWVELLIRRLHGNPALAYHVLSSERWMKRQHHGATGIHHARFMRPHCQELLSASPSLVKSRQKSEEDVISSRCRTDLVLFMPFLHWDLETLRSERDAVAHAKDESVPSSLNSDEELYKAYLTNAHPLHIRRTLDQYYYHTLTDTTERDNDQVVTRYQTAEKLEPRIVTMVDQLWLWVINGVDGQPPMVISCFPHVRHYERLKHLDPDPNGLTDVLRQIKFGFVDQSFYPTTAYDLAGLIVATCSRIYLDPGSTLKFQDGKMILQFSELYETEISKITQDEAVLFKKFTELNENDVADISDEIKLLSRVKDVLDELRIMAMVFDDQRKAIKLMSGIVKSIEASEDGSEGSESSEEQQFWWGKWPLRREDDETVDSEPNDTDRLLQWMNQIRGVTDVNWAPSIQGIRPIWGAPNDANTLPLPLARIMTSIDEIRAMTDRAEKTNEALAFLVDLKQKHNSVMDAQDSLRQGRTVLIFTITTIIFLPLSFMASFFTLDIRQFEKNSEGELDLSYVSWIIFPISSLVSAVLIWIAFKVDSIRSIWKELIGNGKYILKLRKRGQAENQESSA